MHLTFVMVTGISSSPCAVSPKPSMESIINQKEAPSDIHA